jgi:hypothetical protein
MPEFRFSSLVFHHLALASLFGTIKKKKKLLSLEFGPHLSIFIGPTHCVAFEAFDMTYTKI